MFPMRTKSSYTVFSWRKNRNFLFIFCSWDAKVNSMHGRNSIMPSYAYGQWFVSSDCDTHWNRWRSKTLCTIRIEWKYWERWVVAGRIVVENETKMFFFSCLGHWWLCFPRVWPLGEEGRRTESCRSIREYTANRATRNVSGQSESIIMNVWEMRIWLVSK